MKRTKKKKRNSSYFEGYNDGKRETEDRMRREIDERLRLLIWGNIIVGEDGD